MATAIPLQYHCRLLHQNKFDIDETWARRLYDPFWRFYRNRNNGAVIIASDGEEFPMRAGACMLVPAWSRFTTRCTGTVHHTYLHFDPVGIPASWVRERCNKLVLVPRRPDWDALLDAIPINDSGAWALHLRLQAMLCEALALEVDAVGGAVPEDGDEVCTAELMVVQPALDWVHDHLASPLPVEVLANRCGVSRDHFTRVFTRVMGSSPARHVAQQRISAAAMRLVGSEDSIEDIAEAVGFANRSHFSRVFQRVLRISPAAYRRQGRMG